MNMLLYRSKLLSNGQLKRLSDHLYSCENIGLLDPFLQPFWNSLTSKTPLWLAPNLITVSGLLVNIITTLVLVWYSPDAKTEPPRWACLLCAIGLFIYQSLDAIDGKQARRTGTSSPLGELFDHGCDSISTVFVALSACIAVQLGQYPTWMFFQCFCAMTLFYCAHWQTYVSGTMKFGRIDVTEAQCAIILIHLISAMFGPSIWMTERAINIEIILLLIVSFSWYEIFAKYYPALLKNNKNWSIRVNDFPEIALILILMPGFGSLALLPGFICPFQVTECIMVDFPSRWEFRYLIALVTIVCCSLNLYEVLTVIMTGGVGKNGSTVAIPYVQGSQYYQLVVYAITLGYFTWFSFFWKNFEAGGAGKNGSTVAEVHTLTVTGYFVQASRPVFINGISILRMEVKLIVILFTLVAYLGLTHAKGRVIMSGGVGKNGSTVAGTSVLSPIIPFSLVIVPAYIIYKKSETQLYENHPALYILAFGMVSAKVTNRLVVAHMTKNELDYLDTALIGPAMLFLNQYFNFFFDEYYVLWSCLIWVTFDLLRYSCEICQEICDHLKIELFRIPSTGISGKSNSGYKSPSNGQQQSEDEDEEEDLLARSEETRKTGRSQIQSDRESNQTLINFGSDA